MEKEKKQLGVAFIVVLVAIVMVSAIGIIAMSNKPVVLQGQIEATEIRISGKLPGRIDTFLVREGQYVKMGDTLVVINSPEAWAKFQQVNALEDIAKFPAPPIDVMLMIAAVISAASCMQAAGGLDYMVKLAEHLLRHFEAYPQSSSFNMWRLPLCNLLP